MLADQMGADVLARLSAMGISAVLDVIDLRDYATDIANNMVSGYAGPALAAVVRRVEEADAMIAVTPTFSASYSGLFKSFFDVLDPKFLDGMPVFFGATGGSPRHSLVLDMAIRPLFSYLRAHTMSTAIYASPEDWGGAGTNTLERRIGQGAAELAAVLAANAPQLGAAQQGAALTGDALAGTALPGTTAAGSNAFPAASAGAARAGAPRVVPGNHKDKRAQYEIDKMTSLPFEELLAQTQRR